MKSKYPNTSILSLITQTEGKKEKLLFIYVKPVPDFYPTNKIHWYDGAGRDGVAKKVWGKLSIKQWVACGRDDDIIQLSNSLFSSNKLTIAGKVIQLVIAPYKLTLNTEDQLRKRRETPFDTLVTESNTLIPAEFYQKENLMFLSGYKKGSTEIEPLFPLGFFENDFLRSNLKKNIWGIMEHRTAYLTFHGVREAFKKGVGSKEMVGFYQQNFNPSCDYVGVVKNESNKEIGKCVIDKNAGFFKFTLSEPTQRGEVEVFKDGKEEKVREYALCQGIQIVVHVAQKTFKDVYGREFMITSDKRERPESISCFTWQRNVYADAKVANTKLSDLLKTIFDYLGPRILVVDPYFINNINQDKTTKAFSLSHCQNAFINALIHSAIEKGITELNILGCSRATNHLDNDDTGELTKFQLMFESYERIFRSLISENDLEKYLAVGTIVFRKAKEDFHNRYLFSLTDKEGIEVLDKCLIMTNSIGNMSEVDIVPVSDEGQLSQITRAYTGIFKNSEIKLSI